jgi:Zn-dependent protease
MDLPANLSPTAQNMLELAQHYAAWHQSDRTEPEHLLLGLLGSNDEGLADALETMELDGDKLGKGLAARLPPMIDDDVDLLPAFSELSQSIISQSTLEAQRAGRARVDGIDLLAGLFATARQVDYAGPGGANMGIAYVRERMLGADTLRQSTYMAPPALYAGSVRPSPVFLLPLLAMLGSGIALFIDLTPGLSTPLALLFVFSGWIVSLCLHEYGHAIVAYRGGDTSVREAGYLTLNPLKYSHPMLSIGMPLIFLALGGIGLPGGAVYIQTERLRSRAWRSAVALAGPAATLLFGLLMVSPFWLNWYDFMTPANEPFWSALAFLGFLQISSLVFNLLPVPPLDGFGALAAWLPSSLSVPLQKANNFMFFGIMLVMWREGPVRSAFWRGIFSIVDLVGLPRYLIRDALDMFF